MEFNTIAHIKDYINCLRCNISQESNWYKELEWFSTINYTTTSEYLGEILLFVKKISEDDEMKKYKSDLLLLSETLERYLQ